ncbi:sensor histidine kinase [Cupriavidus sp. AU9028]|uniref:sensor histidine kinase n=1 Tax=Cupriavidus sp. AU9028 TaxID=2871157 RepID=UPI002105D5D7|nr:HAMP domain-containing sensor histidine kinase [Cupriavidus sp. AU9028]
MTISALWIGGAIWATGSMLDTLFGRHVDRTHVAELDRALTSLAAALEWNPRGELVLMRMPSDPRFERPYSGAYWQASTAGQTLRSRSLWDQDFPMAIEREIADGEADVRSGPQGQSLLVRTRRFQLAGKDGAVDIYVASDRRELRLAKRSFRHLLWISLGVLGAGLLGAVWAQVRFGLAPLVALRRAVARLHTSENPQLSGQWPREVLPLADEINSLMRRNRETLDRSRRQAADLAHAVKTPLAILANSAARLHGPASQEIAAQVEAMRRQVDRHLARARAAGAIASGTAAVPVRPAVEALVRALARLHADRPVEVTVQGEADFNGDRQDLIEILGNLLDNAWYWTRGRIAIHLLQPEGGLLIRIDDDGPGMNEEAMAAAVAPFARLDESAAGSGLGLAIVRDICEMAGGELVLGRSSWGGLSATLRFASAQA